jgi:peptidoglycan/LPS O-acetylase OafA/YrhL
MTAQGVLSGEAGTAHRAGRADAGRLKQIDSLRAIAVLLVMFEHFAGRTLNAWFPIGAGFLGVGLFFTLSGFLITGIFLSSLDAYGQDRSTALRNFYARRFLRLAPPFYLLIFVLVLLDHEPIASSWLWHVAYLTNFWIVMGNPSNVFWSLAVEEQFYVIWALVVLIWPRQRLFELCIGLICLGLAMKVAWLLAGLPPRDSMYMIFANFGLLGIGVGLALLSYRDGRPFQFDWFTPQVSRRFAALALAGLAIATLSWVFFGRQGYIRYFFLEHLVGIGFGWVIIRTAVGWSGWIGLLMDNGVLRYIGQISYSLYLVHNFVPKILEQYFGEFAPLNLLVLTLGITFGVCALSWVLVEKPILSLKRYFPERPLQKATNAAVPVSADRT